MSSSTRRRVDVTFPSARLTLSGTLELPGAPSAGPAPVALILPGSGPIDRDGDHRRLPLGISRALAEALAERGIASLRYDKRGVGRSEGDWLRTGLLDNVDDARAALGMLADRTDVDGRRVFVVGHSEGAVLATHLRDAPGVAGLVLLSGTSTRGKELLSWQTRQLAGSLPRPVAILLRILRLDIVKRQARTVARIEASEEDVMRLDGARTNARWHRELLAYDPVPHLRSTTVPVLALTGAKDLQVDPADLARIAELVPGEVETVLVPDLTHILRRDEQPASFSRYKKLVRQPVDQEVLERVAEWIVSRAAEGSDGTADTAGASGDGAPVTAGA